jgi:putative colanic acid biosynthesis acetyltransferase WcaF
MDKVDLSTYDNAWYHPGRPIWIRSIWYVLNAVVFNTFLIPFNRPKVMLLRLFGAEVGVGVVVKPRVNIKYPWHLKLGNHVWLGENVWLDSLGSIEIGSSACLSQGVFICTGNHNWSRTSFDLVIESVVVGDGAWIGARSVLLPGVRIGTHVVVVAGTVVKGVIEDYQIWRGNTSEPPVYRKIEADK